MQHQLDCLFIQQYLSSRGNCVCSSGGFISQEIHNITVHGHCAQTAELAPLPYTALGNLPMHYLTRHQNLPGKRFPTTAVPTAQRNLCVWAGDGRKMVSNADLHSKQIYSSGETSISVTPGTHSLGARTFNQVSDWSHLSLANSAAIIHQFHLTRGCKRTTATVLSSNSQLFDEQLEQQFNAVQNIIIFTLSPFLLFNTSDIVLLLVQRPHLILLLYFLATIVGPWRFQKSTSI